MVRIRQSPRKNILSLFEYEKGLTRSDVAAKLGITYWSARYWLDKLTSEGLLLRKAIRTGKVIRRVLYYKPLPRIYFRTQYAIMFYTKVPRTESPDPIAEFRVTGVSDTPKKYNIEEFKDVCVYIGIVLAPQTYWIKQEMEITADELDEPIDVDELQYSVPVFKRLNYCERYAVFFRSRKNEEEKWRTKYPYWFFGREAPLPVPREGDYEYSEEFIKKQEEIKVTLRLLKFKFINEAGRLEPVE